jgi:hypothetical protein
LCMCMRQTSSLVGWWRAGAEPCIQWCMIINRWKVMSCYVCKRYRLLDLVLEYIKNKLELCMGDHICIINSRTCALKYCGFARSEIHRQLCGYYQLTHEYYADSDRQGKASPTGSVDFNHQIDSLLMIQDYVVNDSNIWIFSKQHRIEYSVDTLSRITNSPPM